MGIHDSRLNNRNDCLLNVSIVFAPFTRGWPATCCVTPAPSGPAINLIGRGSAYYRRARSAMVG